MNIVFFGTSNVALPILEALHKQHHVLAVVTQPDAPIGKKQVVTPSPVSVLADEMHLPTLKPEKVKGNVEFLDKLKEYNADVFIVVSYGKILPADVINLPKLKTLNIHFSKLPKYRGAAPIQWTLLNGDDKTATTIFVLDEKMDTGPILAQKEVYVDKDDNFITLSEKLAHISAELLLDMLPKYEQGAMPPQVQNEQEASYTHIVTKADGKIDWNKTSQEIYNQFRAFYDWPEIWTTWNEQTLKILDCVPLDVTCSQAPGTVLMGGQVACGNKTVLKINQLQLAGKNETDIESFLNGYQNFVGSKLE